MSEHPSTPSDETHPPPRTTPNDVQDRYATLEAARNRTYVAYATVHEISRASLRRHGYFEGQIAGIRDDNYGLCCDFHLVRFLVASHDPVLTSPSSRFLWEVIDDLSVPHPPEYAPNDHILHRPTVYVKETWLPTWPTAKALMANDHVLNC